MGAKTCSVEQINENDPKLVARRTKLFNKYVVPYSKMIYKLCAKYSNSPENVEENYSDVMVNFFRRITTYNPSRPIHAWLHVCVKHQVWASEKKRQRHNNKNFDNDIEAYEDEIIDDDSISFNALGEENWRALYGEDLVTILDELAPRYRDALILQASGYSLKEIAEIEFAKGSLKTLNMETIKSRLRFAREYIKFNITRDGERKPRQKNASIVQRNRRKVT